MIATHLQKNIAKGSLKLDVRSSAIAEYAGIIYALRWLLHDTPNASSDVHLLIDNQYVANVCNAKCNYNSKHAIYVQTIRQLILQLSQSYTITIHWIPGHTNNPIHTHADTLAKQAALSQRCAIDTVNTLNYFTDASASGWVWPHP